MENNKNELNTNIDTDDKNNPMTPVTTSLKLVASETTAISKFNPQVKCTIELNYDKLDYDRTEYKRLEHELEFVKKTDTPMSLMLS